MHSKNILLGCLFLFTTVSCLPVNEIEKEPTLFTPSFEPEIPQAAPTFQTSLTAPVPVQPTPGITAGNGTKSTWNGDQMPVFLEVTRSTIVNKNSDQNPTLGVGPSIYFYTSEDKVLLYHSTVKLDLKTEILIGVADILQMPGQVFDQRELVQYPSAQPALVQIAAFDRQSGETALVYGDERFALLPGESRTFKQTGNSSVITMVSNHGRLMDIQQIESDGSLR